MYLKWLAEKCFVKSCLISIRPFHYFSHFLTLLHTLHTFAHFSQFCNFFDNFSSILATVWQMFITLYHVSPLFYHSHNCISILTLFGTLAHLSPQLFILISPAILLVVYYVYHLSPLSQSFANFKHLSSLHWHLDKHWLIWKVLQYTDKYTYLGKCEYNCKDISLLFGFFAKTPVLVIYVHDHVHK